MLTKADLKGDKLVKGAGAELEEIVRMKDGFHPRSPQAHSGRMATAGRPSVTWVSGRMGLR